MSAQAMQPPEFGRRMVQRQRGVYALEFALVFLVFFFLVYGLLTYGLILAAQQTLTMAAQEGARAALRTQNDVALRQAEACRVAQGHANWLQPGCVVQPCVTPRLQDCVMTVELTYHYGARPLMPHLLRWPGPAGGTLNLFTPERLRGSAEVRLALAG